MVTFWAIEIIIRCDLGYVEGQLPQTKVSAPLLYQQLESFGIMYMAIAHVGATLVVEDSLHRVVENRMEGGIAPYQRPLPIVLITFLHPFLIQRLIGIGLQVVVIQPSLHTRPAFHSYDNTNGYIQRSVQILREVIPYSGKGPYGVGRRYLPFTFDIILRLYISYHGQGAEMYTLVLPGIDHLVIVAFRRTLVITRHGHLHVALSATNPYFTGEYILDDCLFTIVKGNGKRGIAGSRGGNLYHPLPLFVSNSLVFLVRPRNGDFYGFPWVSPSPQSCIGKLLKNHVVAHHVVKPYLSMDCQTGT